MKHARVLAKQWGGMLGEMAGLRDAEPSRPAPGPGPCPMQWASASFGASWLGHATCLFRLGGMTVLTDPHFSPRSGTRIAGVNIGRTRSTSLPQRVEQLPHIDLILLSHAHMDHWDKPTLRRLAQSQPNATVVVPARTRGLLPRGFTDVRTLGWDDTLGVDGVELAALKPNHWGARYFWDRHRGYNAYVIDAPGKRVVFGGDTADTDAFDHLDDVAVAAIGIGNYYEPWHLHHANPEQAAAMARRMGAHLLMPVHHSTFRDPSEPIDEPITRLRRAWDPTRIVCAQVGEVHLEDSPLRATG